MRGPDGGGGGWQQAPPQQVREEDGARAARGAERDAFDGCIVGINGARARRCVDARATSVTG